MRFRLTLLTYALLLSPLSQAKITISLPDLDAIEGKIFVYLRADCPDANGDNPLVLRHFIEDITLEDLLLVVEFLTYALPDESDVAIRSAIDEGTKLSQELGANVLIIPYPGLANAPISRFSR